MKSDAAADLTAKRPGQLPVAQLRALIPPMRGCDRCGECCGGSLVANEEEWLQIEDYTQRNRLNYRFYSDSTCGWYDREAGGCAIYPVRPLLCRLFGVVRQHACAKMPEAATTELADQFLDCHYRGPWYRLNGRSLGVLEDLLYWSELLQPW